MPNGIRSSKLRTPLALRTWAETETRCSYWPSKNCDATAQMNSWPT